MKKSIFSGVRTQKTGGFYKPDDDYIYEIKYEEFSVLLKKQKRLILFCK